MGPSAETLMTVHKYQDYMKQFRLGNRPTNPQQTKEERKLARKRFRDTKVTHMSRMNLPTGKTLTPEQFKTKKSVLRQQYKSNIDKVQQEERRREKSRRDAECKVAAA